MGQWRHEIEGEMGKTRRATLLGVSLIALAVAGCDDAGLNIGSGSNGGTEASAAVDRPAATKLVEQDVEAPDVFQKSEAALWDGRPSLGGVWVAHPDVTDPERVIIRNSANDKFVIGALFRRERDNPGPRFQVSSDAAAALGMLAGSPVELNVTALRREKVDETPEPEGEPEVVAEAAPVEAETIAEPEAIERAALDPIASAEAAIERAEDTPAAQAASAAPSEPETETAATGETPKKQRWNPFRRKSGEPLSAIPATASATGAAAGTVVEPAAIETKELKPVKTSATAPRASNLKAPYIQLGIFSVEGNANRTAELMRKNGVKTTVYEQESSGKTFWRVVAGPAANSSERNATLKKVRSLGFTDAYAVRD